MQLTICGERSAIQYKKDREPCAVHIIRSAFKSMHRIVCRVTSALKDNKHRAVGSALATKLRNRKGELLREAHCRLKILHQDPDKSALARQLLQAPALPFPHAPSDWHARSI